MGNQHQVEVEQKTQEYGDKMESDQQKYQQLFNEMQDEAKEFASRMMELEAKNSHIMKEFEREHRL